MAAVTLERAFAHALRQARQRRELTQEGLALAAGLDRTTISLLERGLRAPSLETVFSLSRALDMSSAQLVAETTEAFQAVRKGRGRPGRAG
jgi:DNA-binding XRE family transcriptional regulator